MYLFLGSTNPVKINAVTVASQESWPTAIVQGVVVKSYVPSQPLTDEETKLGAFNRAKGALDILKKEHPQDEILGIGLEGGVFKKDQELWSTVWACVLAADGSSYFVNGARFKIPEIISQKILAGEEMGTVMGKIVKDRDVKQKQGAIGIITEGFVDRTEEYTAIVKLALGLYYGRNWQLKLK